MHSLLTPQLRHYVYNSALLYNLRIFISLAGATGLPWWLGHITWICSSQLILATRP